MRNLFGLAVLFLSFVGVSLAQHGAGHASAPHFSPPSTPHYSAPAFHNNVQPRGDRPVYRGGGYRGGFRGAVGFHDWYGNRPEYRRFGWRHYHGWFFHEYAYLGPGYCYAGMWNGPFFTFGFNASRWRVVDFDLGIVGGWYPGGCAYVMDDPYHYGWYLLYDEQTGQYVHVEQY
jgi:hypothetical protein